MSNYIPFIDHVYNCFGMSDLIFQTQDEIYSPEVEFYWDIQMDYHDIIMNCLKKKKIAARQELIRKIKDRAGNGYKKSEEFLEIAEKLLMLLATDIEQESFIVGKDGKENRYLKAHIDAKNELPKPDSLYIDELSIWKNNIKERIEKSGGELTVGYDNSKNNELILNLADFKKYKLLLSNKYDVKFTASHSSHIIEYLKLKIQPIYNKRQAIYKKIQDINDPRRKQKPSDSDKASLDKELRNLIEKKGVLAEKEEVLIESERVLINKYYVEISRKVKWEPIEAATAKEISSETIIKKTSSTIIQPVNLQRSDTWHKILLLTIDSFTQKYHETPEPDKFWSFLIENPPHEYQVKYNSIEKILTSGSENPLDKENYQKRFKTLYPK